MVMRAIQHSDRFLHIRVMNEALICVAEGCVAESNWMIRVSPSGDRDIHMSRLSVPHHNIIILCITSHTLLIIEYNSFVRHRTDSTLCLLCRIVGRSRMSSEGVSRFICYRSVALGEGKLCVKHQNTNTSLSINIRASLLCLRIPRRTVNENVTII